MDVPFGQFLENDDLQAVSAAGSVERMARALNPGIVIRRIRSDEGPQIRELRLEALGDPLADIAFLETTQQALARPDAEWRNRAERAATATDQAAFVAVLGDAHVGSVVVIVRRAGVPDYFDRVPTVDVATLVGVYVSPRVRGTGVIDGLIEAAADWTRHAGHRELTLDVHERNAAAIASYRRAGFVIVGEMEGDDGREIAMAKRL